jgi:hypothetical protein
VHSACMGESVRRLSFSFVVEVSLNDEVKERLYVEVYEPSS